MARGTVRYWASARAAAGVDEEAVDADTLADAVVQVLARHPGTRLHEVLAVSSVVVDGHPAGRRPHDKITLADGWVAEVLPPFAGG